MSFINVGRNNFKKGRALAATYRTRKQKQIFANKIE